MTPACLERVHALLAQMWRQDPAVESADRMLFATAVAEVATNIIKHLERDSDGHLTMSMTVRMDVDQLEADFADDGAAVVLTDPPEPNPDELSESGRGLVIARAALDLLTYERTGAVNRWHLMRRRSGRTADC